MTSEGAITDELSLLTGIEGKYFFSCASPYHCDPKIWPELVPLDLHDVVLWGKSIGFGDSTFATTRLQRSIAAFTHVVGLGWNKSGETLFRAMQGLEALYCDGVGDLRRQLSHKSQVWLGPTHDKQNIVGKLYDQRSLFVHGSAKMEYRHNLGDPWEEDRKTAEQFSDTVDFAARLLLASLQQCVIRGAVDIHWEYTCKVESPAPLGK